MPPPPVAKDADAPTGGVRVHAFLPTPDRRRGRLATIISFLLHALIIYIAIRLTADVALPEHSPIGDAIQLALGGGGGGGGQGGPVVVHPVAPPPAVVPPPVQPPPPPTVIPPPPTPQPVPPPAAIADPAPASTVAAPGSGAGSGGGNGTGTGTGNGGGQGPGSGSGSGGGTGGGNGGSPPESKQMTVPPMEKTPKELRGKSVDITFDVSADGRVLGFVISPPIENAGFAKRFDEVLREFRFKPGRDAQGKPVRAPFQMTITFGSS